MSVRLQVLFSLFLPLRSGSPAASIIDPLAISGVKTVAIRSSFTHDRDWLTVVVRPYSANEKNRYFKRILTLC
jgi:hypothetical protein